MSNNKYKVLVVEDDATIIRFVETILTQGNYQVITANNGSMGERMAFSHNPDLVVLDLGLPDIDGIDVIKHLRAESSVPILILSARTRETDKVAALDEGANDYITKPFGVDEFLARVRALLRNARHGTESSGPRGGKFELKDMVIDFDKRRVTLAGNEVALTQTEFNILALLAEYAGKVLTYTAIVKAIWGANDSGNTKKIQVNMANIRRKCGWVPGDETYIINELGVGYRMKSPDED
jgi:two-component system, OmpR family, KDP operon response regulator KdpE